MVITSDVKWQLVNWLPVFKAGAGLESEKPVIGKFYHCIMHLCFDNFTHADRPQNKQSHTAAAIPMVSWLEFNVPFQHKYGYIRDEPFLWYSNITYMLPATQLQKDTLP